MYPDLDVKNIERIQQVVEFTSPLIGKQYIQPYKCLYGKYESKPLLVPNECQFKSLDTDKCGTQDYLMQQAVKSCQSMSLNLNVSAYLQWCDSLANFNGIEFVCCANNNDFNAIDEDEDIDDDGSEDESAISDGGLDEISLTDNDVKNDDFEAINGDRDEIGRKKAKIADIDAKYEAKRTEINRKYQIELKIASVADRALIEKENKQKLSEAENEKQGEIFDAEVAFNEILQAKLNKNKYEKSNELQKVQEEVSSGKSNGIEKLKQLYTDLFTLYERDRLLQVSIYKRLKANFPDQFKTQIKTISENLKGIDSVIAINKRSLSKYRLDNFEDELNSNVFSRYKQSQDDASSILKEIESYSSVPSEPINAVASDGGSSNDIREDENNEIFYDSDESNEDVKTPAATTKTTTVVANPDYSDDDDDGEDDDDDDPNNMSLESGADASGSEESKENDIIPSVDTNPNKLSNNKFNQNINSEVDVDDEDDDDDDDDDDGFELAKARKLKSKGLTNVALIVTLCAFSSLVVISVLGIFIRRRRAANRYSKKDGFIQVDTCSPEEAHVNQMQINGYENPAYKYFEQQA